MEVSAYKTIEKEAVSSLSFHKEIEVEQHADLRRQLEQATRLGNGYHSKVSIYFHDDEVLKLMPILQSAGIRVVVDHCGCPDVMRGVDQPGFQAVLALGRSGQAAVKLSGAFRYSRLAWPYQDCEPFVQALIQAYTLENCVWGSDWPFVRLAQRIDYGPTRQLLERWIPDAAGLQKLLWDSPARWFGFKAT